MQVVLFACVHNAGRSQMAAAFFNAWADPAKARAVSGGTDPGPAVNPVVVKAMREARVRDLPERKGVAASREHRGRRGSNPQPPA